MVAGILRPAAGTVTVNGRVSALLELGAGFNPEFSGRDNVYLNGSIMGLSKREIDRRYRQIEIQSQELIPGGRDTWIVYGRALLEMESKNGALLFPIAYTAIHIQADGQWRLLAMQATRVALD